MRRIDCTDEPGSRRGLVAQGHHGRFMGYGDHETGQVFHCTQALHHGGQFACTDMNRHHHAIERLGSKMLIDALRCLDVLNGVGQYAEDPGVSSNLMHVIRPVCRQS